MTEFDLAIYYPIPLLTTEGYISLMQTLIMVAPKNPPPHVAEAIADFINARIDAKAQLVEKFDEDLSTGLERLFDGFVDHVWVELRQRLEFATIYTHEGTAKFTDEDREQLEFEERLAEGRIAAKMLEHMFGNGVDFLRAKYPQQATHMATRLEWVESKNFDEALEEIVGPKLVALLKVCQNRYEEMVTERSSRDGKSVADLGKLRQHLRKQVYAYAGAIGTLYKDTKPETAEIVEDALRPILVAREQTRRAALGLVEQVPPVEDEEDEEDEELEEDEEAEVDEMAEEDEEAEDEEPVDPKPETK